MTTAMICRPTAAALEPSVTGPTATPISTPTVSIPVAITALERLPGNVTYPVRPNARTSTRLLDAST